MGVPVEDTLHQLRHHGRQVELGRGPGGGRRAHRVAPSGMVDLSLSGLVGLSLSGLADLRLRAPRAKVTPGSVAVLIRSSWSSQFTCSRTVSSKTTRNVSSVSDKYVTSSARPCSSGCSRRSSASPTWVRCCRLRRTPRENRAGSTYTCSKSVLESKPSWPGSTEALSMGAFFTGE